MGDNANPYSSGANVFMAAPDPAPVPPGGNPFAVDAPAPAPADDPFGVAAAYARPAAKSAPPAVSAAVIGAPVADPFARAAAGGGSAPAAPLPPPPAVPPPAAAAPMEMDFFTPPPPVQQDTSGSAFAPVAMGGGGGAPEPESFRGEEHLFDPPPVPPAAPPPPAAPMGHQPAAGQPPPERTSKFWRMAFYQQFFQVETKDVTHRIQSVFTPWKAPSYLRQQQLSYSSLGEAVQDPQSRLDAPADGLSVEPDLYGPVWVTSTLWISLAVFGHIASKLAWHGETILTPQAPDSEGDPRPALRSSGTWDYSFAWALVGAAVVYSYSIGVPLLLYFAMRCKQVPVQFFDAFCLYSYSNVTFVAAAVLCIIPVNVLQWLFVVLAGAASTANIVLNLWGAWRRHLPTEWFAGCVGTVAMLHLGLTLFLKLFCFNWSGSDPGDVK